MGPHWFELVCEFIIFLGALQNMSYNLTTFWLHFDYKYAGLNFELAISGTEPFYLQDCLAAYMCCVCLSVALYCLVPIASHGHEKGPMTHHMTTSLTHHMTTSLKISEKQFVK
jgi:hypothetical protein